MHIIIQTTKEINGVVYDYAYSNSGYMIERDGVRYSEAGWALLCGGDVNRIHHTGGIFHRGGHHRGTDQPVYNALAELVGCIWR